jgi:hypothetical protein
MMSEVKLHQIGIDLIPAVIIFLIISLTILFFCITAPTKITYASSVTATIAVSNTCIPIISNSVSGINFGSGAGALSQGGYAATANAENVINLGNYASNIIVDGGNWVYNANNFLVGNTLWALTPQGANTGTPLTSVVAGVDTMMYVKPVADGVIGGNTLYFGVNIPKAQAPGTYLETINIMLSC